MLDNVIVNPMICVNTMFIEFKCIKFIRVNFIASKVYAY